MENINLIFDNGFETALKNAEPFPFDKYPEYMISVDNTQVKSNNTLAYVAMGGIICLVVFGGFYLYIEHKKSISVKRYNEDEQHG